MKYVETVASPHVVFTNAINVINHPQVITLLYGYEMTMIYLYDDLRSFMCVFDSSNDILWILWECLILGRWH